MSTLSVLGRITPQPIRRAMATGFIGGLGGLLMLLTALQPPADLWALVFLLAMGVGTLYLAALVWIATGETLELTEEELREESGRVLCRVEDIASVDRGFFAFKPAGGFIIRLKTRQSRVYAPGLWWRAGRRVMVGGATAGAEAKSVADLIQVMLAQRNQD